MYVRQVPEGRFPRSVRVPQNYSGNAFREPMEEPAPLSVTSTEEAVEKPQEPKEEQQAMAQKKRPLFPSLGFRLDTGRLFRREGGFFGVEELLILGLILLVAGGDSSDEVILLLLLLLFIE